MSKFWPLESGACGFKSRPIDNRRIRAGIHILQEPPGNVFLSSDTVVYRESGSFSFGECEVM